MTKAEKRLEKSMKKAEKLGVFKEMKQLHRALHKKLK